MDIFKQSGLLDMPDEVDLILPDRGLTMIRAIKKGYKIYCMWDGPILGKRAK